MKGQFEAFEQVPALAVQRICGTGLELLRQAGNQVEHGTARLALLLENPAHC